MERFTISLDGALLDQFNSYVVRKGYTNRSEAVRDLLRERLETRRQQEDDKSESIGCLSYFYSHHERELPRRLAQSHHAHHLMVLSTTHVHYDADNCMEIVTLKGTAAALRRYADLISAETGVRFGRLNMIVVDGRNVGKDAKRKTSRAKRA